MLRSSLIAVLVVLVCPAARPPSACTRQPAPAQEVQRPPDVLLITLGATRADRLGCYGFEPALTPNLDRLAARGARFERAYSHVPLTFPAHVSILTGTLPLEHGLHMDERDALGPALPTLAEELLERGYRTGAFVSALVLDSRRGLGRGFEVYDDEMASLQSGRKGVALERDAAQTTDAAIEWLGSDDERPFFCWLHYRDADAPHEPRGRGSFELPYDGELADVDGQIGRLFAWLDTRERLQRTLVVALGDHGLALGEHGEQGHGPLVHETTQRVPLIVALPGRVAPALTVAQPVQQIDVLPTVLGLLGVPAPTGLPGRDLTPALVAAEGSKPPRPEPRPIYVESEQGAQILGWSTVRGAIAELPDADAERAGEGDAPSVVLWKYVHSPAPALHDLEADPGEEQNLLDARPKTAAALRAILDGFLLTRERPGSALDLDLDLGVELGGLCDTAPRQSRAGLKEGEGADPAEHLDVLDSFHLGVRQAQMGNPHMVAEPLQAVVDAFPGAPWPQTLLAAAHARLRHYDQALIHLDCALKADEDFDPAYFTLALAQVATGVDEEALAYLQLCVELRPRNYRARQVLAQRLIGVQEFEAALEQYRAVAEIDPGDPSKWWTLAAKLVELKLWGPAIEALAAGSGHCPDDLSLANFHAWLLATSPVDGTRDGALALMIAERLALATERQDPNVLDCLAAAYAELGRFEEAARTVEAAIAAAREKRMNWLVTEMEERLQSYRAQRPFRSR